jgi:glycosyltransferase involved in cell wall biosynthesis
MFARLARNAEDGMPSVELSLMTTARLAEGETTLHNALIDAAAQSAIEIDVVHERRAWDYRVVRRIAALIRQRRPHVIETHQVKSHFILAQAMLWGGLQRQFGWIAYHHGYTKANLKLTLYEELDRWTLRRADHVVTVCAPFARQLVRRGVRRDRLTVISNAIEPAERPKADELIMLRSRLGLQPQDRVLLSVGRLSPEKGHRNLLAAFAMLQTRTQEPVHLVIVGDGAERQQLESLAGANSDRVHFVGHQQNVWPFYFIAEVFVLPSLTEGSPLVLFEALAAHTIVVATSVGGVPEIIEHEANGLLVEPADSAALSRTIQRVLADRTLQDRLRLGAARAAATASPSEYRKAVLRVYANVLQSSSNHKLQTS